MILPVIQLSQDSPLEAIYHAEQVDKNRFPNAQFKLV